MITAKLGYKNFVPGIAHKYSSLDFEGNRDIIDVLNQLYSLVKFEKSAEHDVRIEQLRKHKQSNFNEWLAWKKEIQSFRRNHLFWVMSKALREEMQIMRQECDNLGAKDNLITLAINQLDNNRDYEVEELNERFRSLLSRLGFTCKTTINHDDGLQEEIYQSTCPDDVLLLRAQKMAKGLSISQKQNQQYLAQRYERPNIIDSEEIFYMS